MITYIGSAVVSKALVSSGINPLDITALLTVCNVEMTYVYTVEVNIWQTKETQIFF